MFGVLLRMTQLNTNVDPLYYLGTDKGRRIDKLQNKMHEQLVNNCSIWDIGEALEDVSDGQAIDMARCFHEGRSSEFYQLILNMMYDRFKEAAIERALEIGEYEY